MTRRGFVKGALALGVAGAAIAGGGLTLRTLVADDDPEVQETFLYVNPEGARHEPWWVQRGLVGEHARLSHFKPGDGANAVWRWYLDSDEKVAGGVSVLLMRVEEDELEFPSEYEREEFVVEGLYAIFNCCTHACCRAGWQLVPPSYYRRYLGFETIYCACHDAQYDPSRIAAYKHRGLPYGSGARYIGVAHVAGPGDTGMPLIPLEVQEDLIFGRLRDPGWYRYLDTLQRPFL